MHRGWNRDARNPSKPRLECEPLRAKSEQFNSNARSHSDHKDEVLRTPDASLKSNESLCLAATLQGTMSGCIDVRRAGRLEMTTAFFLRRIELRAPGRSLVPQLLTAMGRSRYAVGSPCSPCWKELNQCDLFIDAKRDHDAPPKFEMFLMIETRDADTTSRR